MVERARADQPSLLRRSLAKMVAPTARMTGIVPTMSAACETVVRERPLNCRMNCRGTPMKEARIEHAPLGCVEVWAMRDEERRKAEEGEGEAVEDHGADAHLVEGDFSEVEAAAPEAAGEEGGEEAEGAMFSECLHTPPPP